MLIMYVLQQDWAAPRVVVVAKKSLPKVAKSLRAFTRTSKEPTSSVTDVSCSACTAHVHEHTRPRTHTSDHTGSPLA